VTPPAGGLFLWVRIPGVSTSDLLARALAAGVAFVPGTAAYLDGRGDDAMRLNFSAVTRDRIVEGIRRLGAVVDEQRRVRTSLLRPRRVGWRTSAS
jgi:2-aminoadipate transaminase